MADQMNFALFCCVDTIALNLFVSKFKPPTDSRVLSSVFLFLRALKDQ